jgi:hypothetical protein
LVTSSETLRGFDFSAELAGFARGLGLLKEACAPARIIRASSPIRLRQITTA